jgi:hypothetical protein
MLWDAVPPKRELRANACLWFLSNPPSISIKRKGMSKSAAAAAITFANG